MNHHMHRLSKKIATIAPGGYYVTSTNEAMTTVLGSCIAACIRDPAVNVGGMNHFMLPIKPSQMENGTHYYLPSEAMRYGNWAMEFLINEILKQGGERDRLEIKIFGGSTSLELSQSDIGQKNIDFVMNYLRTESLNINAANVGGFLPRKIIYFPDSGVVLMKKFKAEVTDIIEKRERDYMQTILQKKHAGEVELF